MSAKKLNTGIYTGVEYESLEELYFLMWCAELEKYELLTGFGRSSTYKLSENVKHNYIKELKTKTKNMSQLLIREHDYTPDFELQWNPTKVHKLEKLGLLWNVSGDEKKNPNHIVYDGGLNDSPLSQPYSIIEIKPDYDRHNMERSAKISIKWMWQKYYLYVQIIKYKKLFKDTFTPLAYLTTKTGKPRKIDWEVRTINEYLNQKK